MDFQIDGVYPWGRRMSEYIAMFALTPADLRRNILDCAGGPASFNCEMTRAERRVVSCDPLYNFSKEEIHRRVSETFHVILENLRKNPNDFIWNPTIPSPDALGTIRMQAMTLFLQDFDHGLQEERYIARALPQLGLADNTFELALVSHFLFLYSTPYDEAFHIAALRELLRAAPEVRVFPLLTMDHSLSPYLEPVCRKLREEGHRTELTRVDYEFQKGAYEMLVVTR